MSHFHHPHPSTISQRFLFGILLNSLLVVVELFYGFEAQSMALIADALHNIGDVFTLALAWLALWLTTKKRTARYTYGFKNVTILAAFINSAFLMLVVGAIGWEAIQRVATPAPIASQTVTVVATAALIINGFTALLFFTGSKRDLNLRSVYVNMAADAGVSLSVIVGSLLIQATHWLWIDPTLSLVIGVMIVVGNWHVFKESSNLILQAAPASIDTNEVMAYLKSLDNIESVHDLHIWAISSTETALSAHIVVKDKMLDQITLHTLRHELRDRFQIHHSTIQLESEGEADNCDLMH